MYLFLPKLVCTIIPLIELGRRIFCRFALVYHWEINAYNERCRTATGQIAQYLGWFLYERM